METVKTYLLNCSFHGIPFVSDSRFHWSERLFWFVAVVLSWCLSAYIMLSSYDQFKYSAISFTVDTSYLDWQSQFPAIIFCEKGNLKYHDYANEWFDENRDFDTDDALKDIAFFKGALEGISYKCKENPVVANQTQCPVAGGNFTVFAKAIRSKCHELFQYCAWDNKEFPCCEHILHTHTIFGKCFGVNSLVTKQHSKQPLTMTVSHQINSATGKLTVELLNPDMKIFVLSPEEVPLYTESSNLVFDGISTSPHNNEENSIHLAIEEMVNEIEVKSTSIDRRHCRFPDENYLTTSRVYSYSACIAECLMKMHLKMCNCTHHLMPSAKQEQMCDMEGLICLSLGFISMMERTSKCNCESSCTEMEVNTIGSISKQNFTDFSHPNSITRINFMLQPPTLRYVRKVVNGNLDLIVSMGGTAGLCVGASILTAVEIFYYFFVRPLYKGDKQKQQKRNEAKKFIKNKKANKMGNKQTRILYKRQHKKNKTKKHFEINEKNIISPKKLEKRFVLDNDKNISLRRKKQFLIDEDVPEPPLFPYVS